MPIDRNIQLTNDHLADLPMAVRPLWGLVRFYVRGQHQLNIVGRCQLPDSGPAILVCNHLSGLDPLLLQVACPRLVVWMMAREYQDIPGLRWFFRAIEAIPVDRRGRDVAATRAALRALQRGRVVGVFPEGRIATGPMLPFQTGAAMLALHSGAPVYPAAIEGTMRGQDMSAAYLYGQRAAIALGPRLDLDRDGESRERLEAATEGIRQAVDGLRRVATRALAGN